MKQLKVNDLEGQWIGRYVAAGSGLPYEGRVIPARQNAPLPAEPFATVFLYRSVQRGTNVDGPDRQNIGIVGPRFGFKGSDGVGFGQAPMATAHTWRRVVSTRTDYYSVDFFRTGAFDYATRFRAWCSSPLGRLEMERIGYNLESGQRRFHASFYRTTEVRQMPGVINNEYEDRANLDLVVGVVETTYQLIPWAESARVTANRATETFTITPGASDAD